MYTCRYCACDICHCPLDMDISIFRFMSVYTMQVNESIQTNAHFLRVTPPIRVMPFTTLAP